MLAIAVLGILAAVILLTIWRGFILSCLWAWFMVPLGLPEIGVAHAIGVAFLVGMFLSHIKSSSETKEPVTELITPFVVGLIALIAGYIVHSIM